MTTLDIEPYCHNCPEISPQVRLDDIQRLDLPIRYAVTIYCEHRERCRCIYNEIEKRMEEDRT